MGLFNFGKKKDKEEQTLSEIETLENRSLDILVKTFRKHGIDCEMQDGIIIFEKQLMTACAKLFDRTTSDLKILQIDVKLDIGLGRSIVESCAGFGKDAEAAFADVWENFLRNSFHVLLGAFFSAEYDDQIHRDEWVIGGNHYDVTMSNVGIRGKMPENLTMKWHDQLEDMIKAKNLTEETHWIRLYYAQSGGEVYSREILLDNEIWKNAEPEVNQFEFPVTEGFLSVRVFMVLKRKS